MSIVKQVTITNTIATALVCGILLGHTRICILLALGLLLR